MRARHTKSAAGRVEGGQQRRAHTAQGRSRTRGGRGGRDGHAHTTAAAGASGSSSSASGATKDGAEGNGGPVQCVVMEGHCTCQCLTRASGVCQVVAPRP